MSKTSPTQRALAECKKRGWLPAVVEKFNPHVKVRQDLYGFADLVVLDDSPGLLALQVTSGDGGNLAARMRKIAASSNAVEWLKRGLRIEAWAFRKLKVKRGGKATRWAIRRVSASLEWLPEEKVAELGLVDYLVAGKSVRWTEVNESAGPLVDDLSGPVK